MGLAVAVAVVTSACTSSAAHTSFGPTSTPTPSPSPSPSISLAGYIHQVDALLRRSAAFRPQISAAETVTSSSPPRTLMDAHTAITRGLLVHQISLTTVGGWDVAVQAREVNDLLGKAFEAIVAADRADLTWINALILMKPKGTLKRAKTAAVAAETQSVAARATFRERYDALRRTARLAALPSGFQF